jgi:hypothetical protein
MRIIWEYGLFIKDLNEKMGIGDDSFVSIALSGRRDSLVKVLAAMDKDLDNNPPPPPHLKLYYIFLLPVAVFLKRGRHE